MELRAGKARSAQRLAGKITEYSEIGWESHGALRDWLEKPQSAQRLAGWKNHGVLSFDWLGKLWTAQRLAGKATECSQVDWLEKPRCAQRLTGWESHGVLRDWLGKPQSAQRLTAGLWEAGR